MDNSALDKMTPFENHLAMQQHNKTHDLPNNSSNEYVPQKLLEYMTPQKV